MAKKNIHDPEIFDLKKPVPDNYDDLLEEMRRIIKDGISSSKKFYWNMGRYVSAFMEGTHKDKYGEKSIENLVKDLGISKTQLYEYAKIFEAYNEKALERVLNREKVSATHLIYLAKLDTDTARDQIERRIQNEGLNKLQVADLIHDAIGRPAPASPSKQEPAKSTKKLTKDATKSMAGAAEQAVKKEDPQEVWEMANLVSESFVGDVLKSCAQVHAAIRKYPPEEIPAAVASAAQTHIKKLSKDYDQLGKYLGKVTEFWSKVE